MQPHYRDGYIEDVHYYKEGGQFVFTALFHLQRGKCCGNGCRHCPYEPKYEKNNNIVEEKFASLKENP